MKAATEGKAILHHHTAHLHRPGHPGTGHHWQQAGSSPWQLPGASTPLGYQKLPRVWGHQRCLVPAPPHCRGHRGEGLRRGYNTTTETRAAI